MFKVLFEDTAIFDSHVFRICPANLVLGQEDKFHLFETADGKYSKRAKLVGFLVKGKLTPTARIWKKDLKVVLGKEDGSKTKPIALNVLSKNSQNLLKSLNKLRIKEQGQAKDLTHPNYTFAVEDGKAYPVCWEFVSNRFKKIDFKISKEPIESGNIKESAEEVVTTPQLLYQAE